MAGPGTGKTFALQRRVARLLEEGQNPKRILAVTFTRNAAASLVNDLHSLEIAGSEDVRTGTLHSFCFSLLNRSDVFAYVDRVPRPLVTFSTSGSLQFEGGVLLDDLVYTRKFGGKRQCTKQIKAFEAAWARLQSEAPGWAQEPVDKDFENTLVDWLRFHQSMLIGKLIPQSFRYLRNNPMDPITCAYDYVVVDEYQDLRTCLRSLK